VINSDKDLNEAVYQKTAKQILGEPPVVAATAPVTLQRFGKTVATYAR